jgi:hypothetical protein
MNNNAKIFIMRTNPLTPGVTLLSYSKSLSSISFNLMNPITSKFISRNHYFPLSRMITISLTFSTANAVNKKQEENMISLKTDS